MVRHFASKKEAEDFKQKSKNESLKVWKKIKGHKNRVSKPFVVCDEFEWINLY